MKMNTESSEPIHGPQVKNLRVRGIQEKRKKASWLIYDSSVCPPITGAGGTVPWLADVLMVTPGASGCGLDGGVLSI
jgi:hypothetical protein